MQSLFIDFPRLWLIISVVVSQVIGFIWYGPVWGKLYRKELRISDIDMEKGKNDMGRLMLRETVTRIIYFFGLACLTQFIGLDHKWTLGVVYFFAVLSTDWSGTLWSTSETRKVCLLKIGNKLIATIVALLLLGLIK